MDLNDYPRNLEITRLCAEAMGFDWSRPKFQTHGTVWISTDDSDKWKLYEPLTNDAQAMALVKRFKPHLNTNTEGSWWALLRFSEGISLDLNRAICECVAKMQATPRPADG